MALGLSLATLAAALGAAVARHPRLPSPVVAAAGALVLVAADAVGVHRALHAVREIGPTVGFLAALLVLADGCRREGVFDALGALFARRAREDRRRLLALVFAAACAVTIVLGLDATVVLLTPVVLLTASRLRVSARAPAYACVHLANSASLLLPVSNLTNLLAFHSIGTSFARFAALMAAPTAWAVAVDWMALRRLEGAPPANPGGGGSSGRAPSRQRYTNQFTSTQGRDSSVSLFAVAVLALTLAGFVASSALSVAPVWMAVGGAVLITAPALSRPAATATELAAAVQPGFLVFVLALAVIVAAAGDHGLASLVRDVLPSGSSLASLLLSAAVAAALANIVNNLPATLLLVPVAAAHGPGPVLAVLIGVNIGPNLTETGSLATLLWRRALDTGAIRLGRGEFLRLGAVTAPPALMGATALLWLALKVAG